MNFLSPMQWLSVLVTLVALGGLWKYLETTSNHLKSVHAAETMANMQRIASMFISSPYFAMLRRNARPGKGIVPNARPRRKA